jgi:valyl-tRNA synthetase
VIWQRDLGLPVRSILRRDGRLSPIPPEGVDPAPYAELAGRTVKQARTRIAELLGEAGALGGEPRPVTHPVKFWENGTRPLEIVTSRQWFIRYPPKDLLLARGRQLRWHPEFMRARYENWVNGLTGDWNISRQRFFGVPFPVWYPIGDDGQVRWDEPILPGTDRLPVDPTTDVPDGYGEEQRNKANGFAADPDVMDTWATSSLTPQIVGGWLDDPDLFGRVFPMDLRPQAHDIIRTWLFYTIVRAEYHHGVLPWSDAAISGFVHDPDRKKLSKSASNATDDPMALVDRYGADAIRYWAARGRLGFDVALDLNQFKVGRRLATKILNASRFVLFVDPAAGGAITAPVDRSMLAELAGVVEAATEAFERDDYSRALERIESFFWHFCDDYLELVKSRAYGDLGGDGAVSAGAALRRALSVVLRLLAPFVPFVTEEVWSWWREGSIHRQPWPAPDEVVAGAGGGDVAVLATASDVLRSIRKVKSEARLSMRTPLNLAVVAQTPDRAAAVRQAVDDLRAAGHVAEVRVIEAGAPSVEVELAPQPGA